MTTHNETVITHALEMLRDAESASDIAAGCGALIAGLDLRRYVVVDVRGGIVAGLYHNAPLTAQGDLLSLSALANDPVMARARGNLTPFLWGGDDGGEWRAKHADAGFRCGVTAASWGATGSGCIVMLSCSAHDLAAELGAALLRYALMAAVLLGKPIRSLLPNALAPCPLTDRELDCLAYAMAGLSSKETSRALGIGMRTVHQYLERARGRVGVDSSMAAATHAMRHGWLDMRRVSELAGLEARPGQVGVVSG